MMRSVFIAGAAGKMGKEAVKALVQSPYYRVSGAFTRATGLGQDAGLSAGLSEPLGQTLAVFEPQLLSLPQDSQQSSPLWLDLTVAESAFAHAESVLAQGIPMVIGATGFSETQLQHLNTWALRHDTGVLLAPNFSIGALLMMRFAQAASRHFQWAEIIELHHEQKKDAPSGTARITAEMMMEANPDFQVATPDFPARGDLSTGLPIHSVRLQGLLAHQEVILGGLGQTLTLRHDSLDRASFMPGVLLALDKVSECKGLVYGLERFI